MPGRTGKYTEDVIQQALGALMATAVERNGEWVPNVCAVSAHPGMPHRRTLQRWWDNRDRAQDAQLRASVARARSEAREEGALDLFKMAQEALRKQVAYISHDCHYSTETYTDESGREHRRGARLDHATRALEVTLRSIDQLRELLSDEEVAKTTPAERAAAAMRRTKLAKTLKANEERFKDAAK